MLVVAFRFLDAPAALAPGRVRRAAGAQLRDQGDDVHHDLRGGLVLPRRDRRPVAAGRLRREAPIVRTLLGIGWEPHGPGARSRSSPSTRSPSRRSSRTRAACYGLCTGLDYWLGQHERRPRRRVAGLLLRRAVRATSGRRCCSARSARSLALRRPTLLRVFLVWAFVLSLIVYSWAGEKFAWLVLHPLLPLILLAGVGVQAIWASRRRWSGKLALGADGARARLHRLRLLPGQRRPPRRPARAAGLDAVLEEVAEGRPTRSSRRPSAAAAS